MVEVCASATCVKSSVKLIYTCNTGSYNTFSMEQLATKVLIIYTRLVTSGWIKILQTIIDINLPLMWAVLRDWDTNFVVQ